MSNKELTFIKETIGEYEGDIERRQKLIRFHNEHPYPEKKETDEQIKMLEYGIKEDLKAVSILRGIYTKLLAFESIKKSYVGRDGQMSKDDIKRLNRLGVEVL